MSTTDEVERLKSLAVDGIENGVRAVQRTVKSGMAQMEDLKDEAIHQVGRRPLKAVGIAVGIGFMVGVTVGWIGRRAGTHSKTGD